MKARLINWLMDLLRPSIAGMIEEEKSITAAMIDEAVQIFIAKQGSPLIDKIFQDLLDKSIDEYRLQKMESAFARSEHKQANIDSNQNAINRRMIMCGDTLSSLEKLDVPRVINQVTTLERNHQHLMMQFRAIQEDLTHIRNEGNDGAIKRYHFDDLKRSESLHMEILAMEDRLLNAQHMAMEVERLVLETEKRSRI